ncbi:DUF1440 domain-containing protein [Pasteurellaceae bacterium TAE3-ERU1]|uniref:YagU family protein n=1 Tax=Spirabiliibacterium mucosae TaxID=28156 RepID=UPI001AAD2639|nr:DUF1440 domain-containing protein [Spirabiliibacterium mucosae]MBV7389004.1 DUF1440 domain-containing protein [Pasteurellaceae bacterium TAE3-ERU1]
MNKLTNLSPKRYGLAVILGIITGIISGMVKSGSEGFMPPRTPDRVAPPVQMLHDMGIDPSTLIYTYSEQAIQWGGMFIHYVFSIGFAVLYCVLVEIYPKVKLWQGMLFGLFVMIFSHGILLPLLNLSPAPWNLPFDEILSEVIGTALWMWTIEVFRAYLRNCCVAKY